MRVAHPNEVGLHDLLMRGEIKLSKEIEDINDLAQAMAKLPADRFDAAVAAMTALMLGTMRERQGKKFAKGFIQSAMRAETYPAIYWQGPAH